MRSTQKFIEDACQSIHVSFDTLFTWDYSTENEALHKLYEKAKRSQWNVTTDVDWSTEVDPTRTNSLQAQALAAPDDSPFKRFGTKEFERLAWESQAWTLSQFLHGEQGALLATARLVDAVPDIDAKLYAATQVMDEARHVEVFNRYLHDKVELTYPINPYLLSLLRDLLTDSRWDVAYLGMQIMVESLAMAAFGFIHQTT